MASDFFIIFGSIIFAFLLGAGTMLFFGGRTTLNYLLVKVSRGTKILVWADTPYGRKSYVAKILGDTKEGVVHWKYRKGDKLTEVQNQHVGRFFGVPYISLNVEDAEVPYTLAKDGEKPARSIDNKTFNNILKRAVTAPNLDDTLEKRLKLLLVIAAITGLAVLFVAFKVVNVETLIQNLGVI